VTCEPDADRCESEDSAESKTAAQLEKELEPVHQDFGQVKVGLQFTEDRDENLSNVAVDESVQVLFMCWETFQGWYYRVPTRGIESI